MFLESKNTERKSLCPDFSKYLYFLFAPTLLYRDQYPRNTTIRWNFVLQMFGQVLATMLYTYYVVVRFCIPTFSNLNQNEITLPIFVSVLCNSIMPGSLFLLLGKVHYRFDKKKTVAHQKVFMECYIVGSMHLQKCFDLPIECFIRYKAI
jgi:hypothetical protein